MDVLICPACLRRYAVTNSGEGGWRCTTCSTELQIEQNEVSRFDLFGPEDGP
jgi:ribosomal protein L37AE/L43A